MFGLAAVSMAPENRLRPGAGRFRSAGADTTRFELFLEELDYPCQRERDNVAYQMFL